MAQNNNSRLVSLLAIVGALSLILAGCGEEAEKANPDGTAESFGAIQGQFPPQAPDVPGASIAPVGACVSFEGPSSNATLKVVECGSPNNGYKIIQRVSTPSQCPSDVAAGSIMIKI